MPCFILGAGFSLAANAQYSFADKQFAKRYPLASDLGEDCFGSSWKPGTDVEAAFDDAVRARNREPIARLVKIIQTADYYLGSSEARSSQSVYGQLLERFSGAQFLSFNYDSLLEQVLLQRNLWNPCDGFGVAVETGDSERDSQQPPSKVRVLHLHGSVLLYSVEYSWSRQRENDTTLWMTPRPEPKFLFDPDNLGHCFSPFDRAPAGLGYRYPEDRIIVPSPDKSEALHQSYVKLVYGRAAELLRAADEIIAIGYRFAECDRASFEPLLQTAPQNKQPLWIVTPSAEEASRRLSHWYPCLPIRIVPATFERWAESGFKGPR